jgi:hypothetical protein
VPTPCIICFTVCLTILAPHQGSPEAARRQISDGIKKIENIDVCGRLGNLAVRRISCLNKMDGCQHLKTHAKVITANFMAAKNSL